MAKVADGSYENGTMTATISEACRGLVYTSETDAAFEPFFRAAANVISESALLDRLKLEFGDRYEEVSVDAFFERLMRAETWHTPNQKRNIKKMGALKNLLVSNLTNVRVFRIGRIRIDILAVGLDKEGNIAGIRTRAVET